MILENLKKNCFYNSLTSKNIGDKEYEHILKDWNTFQMKTMKDYHNLELKCDVFLADVFENFGNNNLKSYGLCLSHYLSAPAFS